MKHHRIRRLQRMARAVLATSITFTLGTQLATGQGTGWTVQIDPMYMEVFGHDQHVANITTVTTPTPGTTVASQEGVDLEMDGDFAIRGQIEYMSNQWGVGANGFWFNPEGDVSRTLDRPTAASPLVSVTFPGGFLLPLAGGQRAQARAKNDLEVWSADFYGIRTLAETPESHVHMLAGLKIGGIDTDFSASGEFGNVVGGVFAPTAIATFTSTSDTGVLVGPLVGVAGDARFAQHQVKGLLEQSMLFGSVDLDNQLTVDIDPTKVGDVSITKFAKSDDVGIPVTEVQAKYLYEVTTNVSLGLGAFASVWWDAPVAPGVDLTASAAGQGTQDEDTLVFLGGMASVEVKF